MNLARTVVGNNYMCWWGCSKKRTRGHVTVQRGICQGRNGGNERSF